MSITSKFAEYITERAYAFLNESGPDKRRLVFVNGGVAYSRIRCITTIAEHSAKGDNTDAERLYNELTRDGIQGLYNALEATPNSSSNLTTDETELMRDVEDKDHQSHAPLNNPICEAMRAADALDRETESLQLITNFDLTMPALRRSRSLPTRLVCDIPATPSSSFSRVSEDEIDDSYSSACSDEVYRSCAPPSYDSLTPQSISFESAPTTPVIIGEACLINIRPLHSRFSSRGLKSVDYLYAILPMQEDMVIHLKGEHPDQLLERILQDMKEPPPPVEPAFPEPKDEITPNMLETSTSRQPTQCHGIRRDTDTEIGGPGSTRQSYIDDYDPFASHGDYLQSCAIRPARIGSQGSTSRARPSVPPTPEQPASPPPSPPQPTPRQTNRFYELNITNCRTAIETQDSLRSALCTYFLSGDAPCRQHELSSISEIGGDWQPVFNKRRASGGGGDGSEGREASKRVVDLILAFGAQEGVEKEFSAALRGSLERLGTKPKGITRSGRLDLRYLIVSAQRAVPDQHIIPGHDTPDSLLMDPRLLATLVIPFLETYMAIHSEIGFLLLEYPPEHLATVLAMRDLVGGDLLQVAGILDDKADGLGSSFVANRGSEETQATPPKAPSFSKANFVLTSSATESEIATLIAAVWKILVDRSPFYIPDGAPCRMLEESTKGDNPQQQQQQQHPTAYESSQGIPFVHSPLINSDMQYTPLDSAAELMGFRGPPAATTATTTTTDHTPSYGTVYEEEKPPAVSISTANASDSLLAAETMTMTTTTTTATTPRANTRSSSSNNKTAKATALRRQKKAKKLRSLLGRNPDAEADTDTDAHGDEKGPSIRLPRLDTGSFLSINLSDDDDDDSDDGNGEDDRFAADERRYMPLFMRKNHDALRGNSRKALRFLGLSTEA
ncbi:hypothetical protein SLS62_005665 [Diatrype stigma]|uniref:Gastric mucin n=1 Tax=Diatrype stigma TaxID=117547 RepID=A0AAN9YSA8_9PEZI